MLIIEVDADGDVVNEGVVEGVGGMVPLREATGLYWGTNPAGATFVVQKRTGQNPVHE